MNIVVNKENRIEAIDEMKYISYNTNTGKNIIRRRFDTEEDYKRAKKLLEVILNIEL